MIANIKKLLLVSLFGLAFTANASADVIDEYNGDATILYGTNGLINITERSYYGEVGAEQPYYDGGGMEHPYSDDGGMEQPYFGDGGLGVEYSVDIRDEEALISVTMFAVSTNSYTEVFSTRDGWRGEQLDASDWDEYLLSYGSFNSFFGDDLYANIFSLYIGDEDMGGPIMADNDGLFQFHTSNGIPTSDFVAFDANGGIIDRSRADVPEPAPLALLGFGLFVIGLMGKRRKA